MTIYLGNDDHLRIPIRSFNIKQVNCIFKICANSTFCPFWNFFQSKLPILKDLQIPARIDKSVLIYETSHLSVTFILFIAKWLAAGILWVLIRFRSPAGIVFFFLLFTTYCLFVLAQIRTGTLPRYVSNKEKYLWRLSYKFLILLTVIVVVVNSLLVIQRMISLGPYMFEFHVAMYQRISTHNILQLEDSWEIISFQHRRYAIRILSIALKLF